MGSMRNNIAVDCIIHTLYESTSLSVLFVICKYGSSHEKRDNSPYIIYHCIFKNHTDGCTISLFYYKRKHDSCYNPWIEFCVKITFLMIFPHTESFKEHNR